MYILRTRLSKTVGRAKRAWSLAALAITSLLWAASSDAGEFSLIKPYGWSSRMTPPDHVFDLLQGPDGYFWIATYRGLFRFDGFQAVPILSPDLPLQGMIRTDHLCFAKDGSLWATLQNHAIVRWNRGKATMIGPEKGLPNDSVSSLCEGADGAMFAGYPASGIAEIKDGKVTVLGQPEGVQAGARCNVASDREGHVWCAAGSGLFEVRDGAFQLLADTGPGPALGLKLGRKGGFLIQKLHGVVQIASGQSSAVLISLATELGDVYAVYQDSKENLWVGTSGTDRSGIFRIVNNEPIPVGDTRGRVTAITEDSEGNLWVATPDDGVKQLRPRLIRLLATELGNVTGRVESFIRDQKGVPWIAMENRTVLRLEDGSWKPVPELPNEHYYGLLSLDDGSVVTWTPTRLLEWRDGKVTDLPVPRSPGAPIVSVFRAKNGDYWISYQGGMLRRKRDGHFSEWRLAGGSVRVMTEDANGILYFAPAGGHLFRFAKETLQEVPFHDSGDYPIHALLCGPDGRIWIGFDGGGLGCIRGNEFIRATTSSGLPDDMVYQLLADDKGRVWLSSHAGFSRIDPDDFTAFATGRVKRLRVASFASAEDEIKEIGKNRSSGFCCRNVGPELWFSHGSRVVIVDPEAWPVNTTPPPVVIEAMRVDNHPLEFGKELRLPPSHSRLEFQYSALSFNSPENNHFRYKLEGYDEDWVEAGSIRQAGYSRLTAGKYQFKVSACNSDGFWNEAGAGIPFSVAPFFYQTLWFRAGVILLALAAGVAITRRIAFARLRSQLAQLERERALATERTRIARDIHDDLGSSLGQLAWLGELARTNNVSTSERDAYYSKMTQLSRQLTKTLSELVWAVNPRNDNLPALATHMGTYATEYLHSSNVRILLKIQENLPAKSLSAAVRHNILMITREALHNIVKHAKASQVWMQLDYRKGILHFELADDGQGFDLNGVSETGNGLRNMEDRIRDIGGVYACESHRGAGTKITFDLPLVNPSNRDGDSS